jgi:hypothetical protein
MGVTLAAIGGACRFDGIFLAGSVAALLARKTIPTPNHSLFCSPAVLGAPDIFPILRSMRCQFVFYLLYIFFLITGNTNAGQVGHIMHPEQTVCGLKEPLIFWLWSSQAGRPDQKRLRGLRNVQDIFLTTRDGRILRGYKLAAEEKTHSIPTVKTKGYLLVLQGNAILADQILGEFSRYAAAGYDVYIYDYRGYGRSEGKRRLKAMVGDYKEILASLGSAPYRERLVYAMSFGGILLLDALEPDLKLDRVVIDSSPARLSGYGCPTGYDPVNNLPADCSHYLFIVGLKDHVVSPAMSRELVEKARKKGATIVTEEDFSHPFMDPAWSIHQRRMKLIADFLIQK